MTDLRRISPAPGTMIENKTFDEIEVGETASLSRMLSQSDVEMFAVLSGDTDPAHVGATYSACDVFHHVVAHGMWGGSLISAALGTILPGPGTTHLAQTLRFLHPVSIGDTVTASITVREKRADGHRVVFECRCTNQNGVEVVAGTAEVIAPTERVRRRRRTRPDVQLRHRDTYRQLLQACAGRPPVVTAVAYPCDALSMTAVIDAADAGLIEPVLVGPEATLRAAAEAARLDLSPFRIVPVPHSRAAAAEAVRLARTDEVGALMRGGLQTDELMQAVMDETDGLRTARRISHAYVMDIPTYPKPLVVTDAAINSTPSLEDKRDICQNAIDLTRALGVARPKLAILGAVETVPHTMRSTIDAAALSKMAEQQQIAGGVLDGPFGFDTAIDCSVASAKGIRSSVAGDADILLVPDVEAGNVLANQLTFLAGADAAGIVLGARVPIILTGRSDSLRTRLTSCAVAVILANTKPAATAATA